MFELLGRLKFKTQPQLIAFAVFLIGATGLAVYFKLISGREALVFLGGALGLPGLFGSKTSEETKSTDDEPKDPPTLGPSGSDDDGLPPRADLMRRGLLLAATGLLTGCSWLQSHGPDALELLAQKGACALRRMNLPEEVIWKECGIGPEDIEKIVPMLTTARQEAAAEAVAARADERAKVSAERCAPVGGSR